MPTISASSGTRDHYRVVLGRGDVEVLTAQLVGVDLVYDEPLQELGAAGN
jgi:hypothetical protein